ncbi:unnamed protein product, partial [Mesorhabditis spiculigera]
MGRVGCMPCINVGKMELFEIARRFPEEVERIAQWEEIVKMASKLNGASFLASNEGEHIWDKVDWSKTVHGGKQIDLFKSLAFDDVPETYFRIIDDISERLKRIAKQYKETGDAEAMHLGIMQILLEAERDLLRKEIEEVRQSSTEEAVQADAWHELYLGAQKELEEARKILRCPQGFVKAIKEKQQEEIKRLELEVDDLRAPVKLPGEVYDSFINIKKTYPETAFARVMEYIHIDAENHWEKLNDDFNTFAYWVDRNKSLLGRMMTYGYERGESAKEKWIKNMMALLNDPHIDQKGFLSGIYEQYQVADILKNLEGNKDA